VTVSKREDRQAHQGQQEGRFRELLRWLQPGLGIKRWILFLMLSTTLIGLGLAYLLLDVYRANPESTVIALISLRALPRWLRALLLIAAGSTGVLTSFVQLNRALLAPFVRPGRSIVNRVSEHRRLGRGPKIVALGGGTGLSTLLRGLKQVTGNLTAIVTVADDGGSSGRLRRSLGLPPPGDIRSCLAALSNDEGLLTQLFLYRFGEGEELNGHSFGNLFIAALSGVTGSFDAGVLEAGRILGIQGRVMPSTLTDVQLIAEKSPAEDSPRVQVNGESRIPTAPGRIRRISLQPDAPNAYPGAIQAILGADMVVIGPGSLYTSLLPNLLVPDIAEALRATRAFRVFVCNVASQRGETDGFDCGAHYQAVVEHVGEGLVDLVIANENMDIDLPNGVSVVQTPADSGMMVPVYAVDLVDQAQPWRHDTGKLTAALIALLEERTGPLELASDDPLTGMNNHL